MFIYIVIITGQGGFFLGGNRFLKEHIKNNGAKYIVGVFLFAVSVFAGSYVMANLPDESSAGLVRYFSGFVSTGKSNDIAFGKILKACTLSNIKYIAAYFLLALTVYSSRASLLIPAYKGFASGFTCTFIIKNYGLGGVLYSVLSVIPSITLLFPIYLFASVVCINFAQQRRAEGRAGVRSAVEILPALAVIFCAAMLVSVFDAFISPVVFKYVF